MNRALVGALSFSLALHAGALAVLPWSPLHVLGLGLGAPAPPPSECPVRFVPFAEPAPIPPEDRPPQEPPLLAADPSTPASAEESPLGLRENTAALPTIELPVAPDPAAPDVPAAVAGGDLSVLPPLPPPNDTTFPIRLEDLRWNRKVGARIGQHAALTPELQRLDLHGSVRLMLYLTPEGIIRDLRILDAGPHPALTLAAQAQVRAGAPFPPAPAGMDVRLLKIPVNLHY